MKRVALMLGLWLSLNASHPPSNPVDDVLIQSAAMPEKLSAFRLVSGLQGNIGVKPYTLNTALFSDYAEKWRYLYLPNGTQLNWSGDGLPRFPVGSVLIKSFGYPADFRQPDKNIRLIETRLLIHRASGWVALPYVWDADGKDATLRRAGARIAISWTHSDGERREISYAVPNVNQCKGCHNDGGQLTPIGPKARNIASGILHPTPLTPLPRWDDSAKPIDQRARAYLDVNCGHCHNRAGAANTSGLWLNWDQKADVNLGIGKRPTAAGRGSGDRDFAIAPGHPEKSILIYRMESLDPGIAMPELGRASVHKEAVAMLSEWIKTIK